MFKSLSIPSYLTVCFTTLALVGCGCSSEEEPVKIPEPEPEISVASLMVTTNIFNSSPSCPNGGIEIPMGFDQNGNGELDNNEITSIETVCNGTNGVNALIAIASLPAGSTCPAGGLTINVGLDLNGDKILKNNEITQTSNVCHGQNGAPGEDGFSYLISTSAEAAGSNCPFGGVRIESGKDTNRNNLLDESEVEQTQYVCNGSAGNTAPTVPEETAVELAVNQTKSFTLLASDVNNDRLSFILITEPEFGKLTSFSAENGEVTYQPNANYVGNDSFTYRVDDGQYESEVGKVSLSVQPQTVAAGYFQIDTNNLQIVDSPDGLATRSYYISGVTVDNQVTAELLSPAALNAKNLRALTDDNEETVAVEPVVLAPLQTIPNASGTTIIEVSLYDGADAQRGIGERQIIFSYEYDWTANGSQLSVAPSPAGNAWARYFTRNGEVAVSLTLDNSTAEVFHVTPAGELQFTVASLFADDQLGGTLQPGVFGAGSYFYKVKFTDFPVVDTYGNSFSELQGRFNVSNQPLPVAQNINNSFEVREGQLTQINAKLRASGGTGPLIFSVVEQPEPGTIGLNDDSTGDVTYQPKNANLLVSDALSFKVNDGFTDSNEARAFFTIRDDRARLNASLRSVTDIDTKVNTLTWTDNWTDETGYRVEQYNDACGCWQVAELLAPSPESGLPFSWQRAVSERSYYRVFVMLPEGDEMLAPGVVVANADFNSQLKLDQTNPVSGVVELSLVSPSPLIQNVQYYINYAPAGNYWQCRRSDWPRYACSVNTSNYTDGNHEVLVETQLQPSSYVRFKDTFTTESPVITPTPFINLSTRVHTGTNSNYTPQIGTHEIQAYATQSNGISHVELSFENEAGEIITSPNSRWANSLYPCAAGIYPPTHYYCTTKNAYTWTKSSLVPGGYQYQVKAVSYDGNERERNGTLYIPLDISLISPNSDSVSGNTLAINGSVGTTNNPVRITVSFGSLTVLDTTGPVFNATLDVSNVAAGTYTLRVTAKDIVTGHSSAISRSIKLNL